MKTFFSFKWGLHSFKWLLPSFVVMEWLLHSFVVMISLGISAVTVVQSFRFGIQTYGGEDNYQAFLFGACFALIDLAKYAVWWALATKRLELEAVTKRCFAFVALLGAVASVYAMAMVGLDGLERSAAKGRAEQTQLAEHKDERARLERQIAELGTTVPPAVFERKMKELEYDRRWQSTKGCTDATLPASRTFCTQHARLFSKLAAATKSNRLQAKIEKLTLKIRDATTGDRISRDHAGLAVIARWLGEVARWFGGSDDRKVDVKVEDVALINLLAGAILLEAVGLVMWQIVGALGAPIRPSETSARDDQEIADTSLTTPNGRSGRDQSRSHRLASAVGDNDTEELTRRRGTRQVRSDIKDHITAVPSVQSVPSIRQGVRSRCRSGAGGKRRGRSRGALTGQSDATPSQSASSPATDISAVPDGSTVATYAQSCLVRSPGSRLLAQEIRQDLAEWSREHGHSPLSAKRFSQEMKNLGFETTRGAPNGALVYHDVKLLSRISS